ncbi:MAG: aminotransferase class I/II-fold pyridoxal phosphate-dependent enzyme [Planctomycetes bacterium]|nr:aminotransferase class I/II-fold pyridoxal phosphate-dependent enzyme [Planctomycetota bacterium]
MTTLLEEHFEHVPMPANLRINDQIKAFPAYCRKHGCTRPYHHFAFGQSPFPLPPCVIEALRSNASQHDYLPTAGLPDLRKAIAKHYRRHFGVKCTPDQVVVSPGSKEMIAMLLAVLRGPVVVPTPSWVSYLPQAKILRKKVIVLPTRWEDGFKVTPDGLARVLASESAPQKILILNHPHNPTGLVYSRRELQALSKACRRLGVIIISDEIYALTTFEETEFTSMMSVFPEGTVLTGGLSKDRSCGGYRCGVGILPKNPAALIRDVLKVAGATYSCVAAPIQYAALEAYSGSDEVESHMRDCARLNEVVGRITASLLSNIPGVRCTFPQAGFYVFVDFNELRDDFLRLRLRTSELFVEHLLRVEHTALLAGSALLLPDDYFCARCSFVDYDGQAALAHWRASRPTTSEEEEAFVREHCPLIVEGVANLARYLEQVRAGKRPKHVA